MSKHLSRDMDHVHQRLLSLSAVVEEMIDKAARSLMDRDVDVAEEVIEADEQVDRSEVHIENECLKILALHQPVAIDLRRIATVVKVNNDLERIADLAVNMAERAVHIAESADFPIPDKLPVMVRMATDMVRGVLDAFVNLDSAAARRISLLDSDVNQLNREIIEQLQTVMKSNADLVEAALHCFSATRHIERIADHATNIAEDVVYLVEGEIVRHARDLIPRPAE